MSNQDIIISHISEDSGKEYLVNLTKKSCSCLDYKLRQQKVGGMCKHLRKEYDKRISQMKDYSSEILENNDAIHFVEKYGEDVLGMLKIRGTVFEKNGKLFLI